MAIKKDGNGKRWVEMELLLPGTPEQVWDAMATGSGMSAWFIKADVEQHVGGNLAFDFGRGVTTHGKVTAWQPPALFGYVEEEWEPGAPPIATEITITERSGSECLVRMVHSLFTSSDAWDDQVEGFESGWPGYFDILRLYLKHYAGHKAASFMVMTPVSQSGLLAWQDLAGQFGVAGANVGERVTSSAEVDPWSGVLERIHQTSHERWVIVRIDTPAPGIVLMGTRDTTSKRGDVETRIGKGPEASVSICRYYYGDDVDSACAAGEARWAAWAARR